MNGDPSPGSTTRDGTDAPNDQTSDRTEATPLRFDVVDEATTRVPFLKKFYGICGRLKCVRSDSGLVRVTKEILLNTTRGLTSSIGAVDELVAGDLDVAIDEPGEQMSNSGTPSDPTAKARERAVPAARRNVEVGGAFWRQSGRPPAEGPGFPCGASPSAGWRDVAFQMEASSGTNHENIAKSDSPPRTLRPTPQLESSPAESGDREASNFGGSDDDPQFSGQLTLEAAISRGHHKGGVRE